MGNAVRRRTPALQRRIDDVPEEGVENLMTAFRAYQAERADDPGG